MIDPAYGLSRAVRALGEFTPKRGVRTKPERTEAFGIRDVNNGMFSGPKPKYGRYSASDAASDVVKKKVGRSR